MRIVLDTNILVRANIKAQGPAREALLKIISGIACILYRRRRHPRVLGLGHASASLG